MAFHGYPVLGLLVLLGLLTNVIADSPKFDVSSLNRTSFPIDFIFGTASSAYHVTKSNFLFVNLYHSFSSNVLRCQAYEEYNYLQKLFFQISLHRYENLLIIRTYDT